MGQVLVLNASYEPLNVTSWRRATVMLLMGKAEGLEHDAFSQERIRLTTEELIGERDDVRGLGLIP